MGGRILNAIEFTSTHKKLHIAQLWRLPERGAPYTKETFFALYRAAVAAGKFPDGTPVNFSLPGIPGGLLTAACEARQAGLPCSRIIVGCNENRTLVDTLRTGVYREDPHPQHTGTPLLDCGSYPEAAALAALPNRREIFAAYSIPAHRAENMQRNVLRDAGVSISRSTAVVYTALQDHRCVTADGLHAILLALEE